MNRRNFFKALAVAPAVAIGGAVIASNVAEARPLGVQYYWQGADGSLVTLVTGPSLTEREVAAAVNRELVRVFEDMA